MSENMGYVVAAWLTAGATIAAYTLHLVRRGRALSRQVPKERRRWTS